LRAQPSSQSFQFAAFFSSSSDALVWDFVVRDAEVWGFVVRDAEIEVSVPNSLTGFSEDLDSLTLFLKACTALLELSSGRSEKGGGTDFEARPLGI